MDVQLADDKHYSVSLITTTGHYQNNDKMQALPTVEWYIRQTLEQPVDDLH